MEAEIKNAVIRSAKLTIAEHGYLSVWIDLDYGGLCQSFGGHTLYLPSPFNHHEINSFAGHFIYRCLQIAGVSEFKDLRGKTIRVRATDKDVYAIGHIVNNDWFDPNAERHSNNKKEQDK